MKKQRINTIVNVISAHKGLINGNDGFIVGKFETSIDTDRCFNAFAHTGINLLSIRRHNDNKELWVRV